MFKDYDWLLFDLDNTLLDFSQTSKRAFQELSEIFEFHEPDSYHTYHQINAKYWHYFEKHKINDDSTCMTCTESTTMSDGLTCSTIAAIASTRVSETHSN